jgi:hypothetical protein
LRRFIEEFNERRYGSYMLYVTQCHFQYVRRPQAEHTSMDTSRQEREVSYLESHIHLFSPYFHPLLRVQPLKASFFPDRIFHVSDILQLRMDFQDLHLSRSSNQCANDQGEDFFVISLCNLRTDSVSLSSRLINQWWWNLWSLHKRILQKVDAGKMKCLHLRYFLPRSINLVTLFVCNSSIIILC